MSQQDPAVYNLEYFGDADFWEGASESPRRTLLMPLADPTEFLGFGVYGPANTVHFVARGRVREHLGDFLSRMAQAEASVELYERVPLPWPLVKRYLSDDPFQGVEEEPPPPNPGLVSLGGGTESPPSTPTSSQSIATYSPTWPQDSFEQQIFIMPLAGYQEFLAMGVCKQTVQVDSTTRIDDRFVFAARGEVGTHLGDFVVRLRQADNSVQLCDWPPLDFLQHFVFDNFRETYEQRAILPATGETQQITRQAA